MNQIFLSPKTYSIMSNPLPSTNSPLVTTPTTPCIPQGIDQGLGPIIHLVGNWTSLPAGTYSWNVMPLPQDDAPDLFILKNFAYSEEITFAKIPGTAPNRGGGFTQVANTLFYEQRVYFSPGGIVPAKAENTLVHAENGSWLYFNIINQKGGAFGEGPTTPLPDGIPKLPVQPAQSAVGKQMSVPHGNSILAVGSVMTGTGKPSIKQVSTIPSYNGQPYGVSQYGASSIVNGVESNPNINPNIKLLNFLDSPGLTVTDYIHYNVSAPQSEITNISFETKHSKVTAYEQDVWILNPNSAQPILMYSQNIGLDLDLVSNKSTDMKVVSFPHITCNVLNTVEQQTVPTPPATCS